MNAVEFHTIVENGSIAIPPELQGQILGPVRVIVLTEDMNIKDSIKIQSSRWDERFTFLFPAMNCRANVNRPAGTKSENHFLENYSFLFRLF